MLLTLHESINSDLENVDHASTAVEALENIALGRREGKHALLARRDLLQSIGNNSSISARARSVFLRTLDRLSTEAGYQRLLSRRVEIVSQSVAMPAIRWERDCAVIQVPLSHFADSESVQRAFLMGENLTDLRLYTRMANFAATTLRLGNVPLSYDLIAGGGGTSAQVYQLIQDSARRFCLCVLDGDLTAPDSSVGETASAVRRVDNPSRPLSEVLTTSSREAENLLPTSVLSQISERHADRMRAVSVLDRIEASPLVDTRFYLDLKDGFRLKRIFEFAAESASGKYWRAQLAALDALSDVDHGCVMGEECLRPDGCTCWIIRGFGPHCLTDAAELLGRLTPHKISEMLTGALETEWLRLGRVVLAWCCGAQRIAGV